MYKKQIEKIIKEFDISLEKQSTHKNPWGNFLSKVDLLFRNGDVVIKAKIIKNNNIDYFISESFPNSKWKVGYAQTWHYIYFGLFFLGLIDNREYSDSKIEKGLEIEYFRKYQTLFDYLNSPEAKINIMNNFRLKPTYFRGMIRGALLEFITRNDMQNIYFNHSEVEEWLNKKYKSKFALLFEVICIALYKEVIFKESLDNFIKKLFEKENVYISKDIVKREITSKEKEIHLKQKVKKILEKHTIIDFKAASKKQIEANPLIRDLRSEFRSRIKNEMFNYKKTLKVINEYKTTFDLNKEIGPAFECAHIMPVYLLAKQKRWEDIANPNNGLILDPTTHRLFDLNELKFSGEELVLWNDYWHFEIDHNFINKTRVEFLKEKFGKIV